MFKRLFRILLFFLFFFSLAFRPVKAQEEKLNLYFFWGQGCPHCAREKIFLDKLQDKYSQLEVVSLEVGRVENYRLWREIGQKLDVSIGSTPFTVVGEHHFTGYYNDEITGKRIEEVVLESLENGAVDLVSGKELVPEKKNIGVVPDKLSVPLLGEVNPKDLSLPVLSVILGVLDGFNPCAMWTLLFLISLLLGMRDKRRMWILGTAFIAASALVYFLFMTAWLNLFLFMGVISWVRILIGVVALGAGVYSLRDYFKNKDGACKITGGEKKQKVFERLKNITQEKDFFLALGGIIILAFVVNLVELVCSAGLPAVFTQVLSLNNLSRFKYFLYILIYIFFFMIDDLFVFFGAMLTLKAVGVDGKYARFSRLFGGIIIFIIGMLLLFKPEWLMF